MKRFKPISQAGLLLIEVVLAVAIFSMLTLIVLSAFVYGRSGTATAGDNNRASDIASEALEAVRNIAQGSYSNLTSYSNGVAYYISSGTSQWTLTTTPTKLNSIYTPVITFSNGPSNSRQVSVSVSWTEGHQTDVVSASTYISNWRATTAAPTKTGLLVYANGGTTTDSIKYLEIQANGTWTNPASLPNVDNGGAARVPWSVKIYPVNHGNNKAVLARYFDGTNQYIYGFIWNGSSWSTPQLLTQWASNDYLDVGNFSGAYLANNTFLAVYTDHTSTPKYRTYNGTTWSAQSSLPGINGDNNDFNNNLPTSITVQQRPGTNDAMAAFLISDTSTDGIFYTSGAWGSYQQFAPAGSGKDRKLVDFAWSPVNPLQGAAIFTQNGNDKSINAKVFTTNGSGSASWGNTFSSTNQPPGSVINSIGIVARPNGSEDFMACDKDITPQEYIYCYKFNASAGFSNPANQIVALTSAFGPQRTYDLSYELINGNVGLIAYSDNTVTAELKRFDTNNDSLDASPLSMSAAASIVQKTRLVSLPNTNDAMLLATDAQNNLYSVMYNGTLNAAYTTPAGYAWTIQNANGPSVNSQWFDFAWDD